MNYIDTNRPNILKAKDEHHTHLSSIIKRKLLRATNAIDEVRDFLNNEDELRKVLVGSPTELNTIKNKFVAEPQRRFLERMINYDAWVKGEGLFKEYSAYTLANNLDIPTCPYCSRMYTKTVIMDEKINSTIKKVTRPTFDHWFPKAKYPLLALSFYNLVPSCHVCNCGVKGKNEFRLHTHFHPYHNPERHNKLDYSFSYELSEYNKHVFKMVTVNPLLKTSIEAFKLKEIYETHEDEIKDLVDLRNAYSQEYLQELKKAFPGSKLSDEEIYRFAFGTYLDEDKFDRRPLSRMKRDILKELGVLGGIGE